MQKAFEARMAVNANAQDVQVQRRKSAANGASLFSMLPAGDRQRRITFAGAATSQIIRGNAYAGAAGSSSSSSSNNGSSHAGKGSAAGGKGKNAGKEHTYERLVVVAGEEYENEEDNCSTVDAAESATQIYPMSTWADAIDAQQAKAGRGLAIRQESQDSAGSSEHYCLRTMTDGPLGCANTKDGPRDVNDDEIYSTANM